MAGRGVWAGSVVTAVLSGLLSVLSGQDGDEGQGELAGVPAETERGRRNGQPPTLEDRAASFGEEVGRIVRTLGAQGEALRERAEGLYGMYRLLRAFGMTDQEIAALIAREAGERLQRGLRDSAPTTANVRRVVDGLQELVIHAAEDVDERLDLGGDFVSRVRDVVQASRTGREDVLIAVERGAATAREQMRRILDNFSAGA
jgi:hypothetical protein